MSSLSVFTFPAMPAAQRKLILDLGELLHLTQDRYLMHLQTELRLLREAADLELADHQDQGSCYVLPFRRRSL